MAIRLSIGVLLGIIIGAVALVLAVAIVVIIILQRVKHRRLMAETYAAGERRISKFPGGNISIRDEDVVMMPGTGSALRNALRSPKPRSPNYVPMASREDIDDSMCPNCASKRGHDPEKHTTQSAHELPLQAQRSLKRATGHPMIEMNSTTLSPVNENKDCKMRSKEDEYRNIFRSDSPGRRPKSKTFSSIRLVSDMKSDSTLKPNPLFHEKHRSISHGMLSDYIEAQKENDHGTSTKQQTTMPRSISLCSQEATMPPSRPVPTLPPEAVALSRQRSLQNARNSVRYSFPRSQLDPGFSQESHALDSWDGKHGHSLHKDATHTSALPNIIHGCAFDSSTKLGHRNNSEESVLRRSDSAQDRENGRLRTLKPPTDAHRSLQASIRTSDCGDLVDQYLYQDGHQYGVPSAEDSCLSTTIVSGTSADLTPRTVDTHISVFDFNLPASSAQSSVRPKLEHYSGISKRSSASILQTISGNEQASPRSQPKRPTSVATEYQLRSGFSPLDDQREKTLGTKCHKRGIESQVSSSPNLALSRTEDDQVQYLSRRPRASEIKTLRQPRVDPPSFRPPSRSTFDPQLLHPLQSHPSPGNKDTPHTQALARLNGFDDFDSSPGSDLSTPTKKPSKHRPSASHPNRQRPIFDSSSLNQWPLARGDVDSSVSHWGGDFQKAADYVHVDAQQGKTHKAEGSATLYKFPSPPSLTFDNNAPAPSQPKPQPRQKTALHGPRTPPRNSFSRPNRNKPSQLNVPRISEHNNSHSLDADKAASDLRKSVIALRRMNSSIVESSSESLSLKGNVSSSNPAAAMTTTTTATGNREHKRYLCLSDRESRLFVRSEEVDRDIEARMRAIASAEDEGRYARMRRRGPSPVGESPKGLGSMDENLDGPADWRGVAL